MSARARNGGRRAYLDDKLAELQLGEDLAHDADDLGVRHHPLVHARNVAVLVRRETNTARA